MGGVGIDNSTIIESAAELGITTFPQEFLFNKNIAISDMNGNIISENELNVFTPRIQMSLYKGATIVDENMNVALEFCNGKINTLYGKTFSIIGDSISTYQGYLPDGFGTFYPRGDVDDPSYTWWGILESITGMKLLKNASWTASRVMGDSQDSTGKVGCSDKRIAEVADGSVTPDIILIFMGTNDFGYNSPIGSYSYGAARPSEGIQETFADAYSLLLYKLNEAYPLARVYCCTPLLRVRTQGVHEHIFNDLNESIASYCDMIKKIAYGSACEIIDLRTCGFNIVNVETYMYERLTHPNKAGMYIVANAVKNKLELTSN